MINERFFPDSETTAAALAEALAAVLSQEVMKKGQASIAVSGGRTPRLVLPKLARLPVPWDRVHVTLIDERWVDVENEESNEKLVRECLLQQGAGAARFTGLKTSWPMVTQGRIETEQRLSEVPFPLDAVYLGMGEDGHIASLFPGNPAALKAPGRCVAVPEEDGRKPRISMTLSALLDASRLFLMISGYKKFSVYEEAKKSGEAEDLPVRSILKQDRVPVEVFVSRQD